MKLASGLARGARPISRTKQRFNPAELRQLRQAYVDLLELHRAEVVDYGDFEDAHRLLVEQVIPLREILRHQDDLVVDPDVELTY
jgi:hypothetical protein